MANAARLPAPVALDAGCALVAIWPDGHVSLLPRPAAADLSAGNFTSSRHTSGMTVRRGRVVVFDHGVVRWRSRGQLATGPTNPTRPPPARAGWRSCSTTRSTCAPRPHGQLATWPVGHEHLAAYGVTLLGVDAAGALTLASHGHTLVVRRYGFDGRVRAAAVRRCSASWHGSRVLVAAGGRLVATDGGRWPCSPATCPRAPRSPAGRRPHRTDHAEPGARPEPGRAGCCPPDRCRRARCSTPSSPPAAPGRRSPRRPRRRRRHARILWTLRPGARQATPLGSFIRPPTCAGYGPGGFSGRFLLLQVPAGTVRVVDTARAGPIGRSHAARRGHSSGATAPASPAGSHAGAAPDRAGVYGAALGWPTSP